MASKTAVEAQERVLEAEEGMWAFLRECIGSGHSAAALMSLNLDQPWPMDVLYDDEVEVEVQFRQAGGAEVSLARLKLIDALRLAVRDGVTIGGIGAPSPRSPAFFAVAAALSGSTKDVVMLRDLRGFGRLSMSSAPPPPGTDAPTFGDWYQHWAERSGVGQVNARRKEAIRHLQGEYGDAAGAIVTGARQDAIASHTEQYPPGHEWLIARHMSDGSRTEVARIPVPKDSEKSIAESVLDTLSTEAFGAPRRSLPRAQDWEKRLEDEPEPFDTAATHRSMTSDDTALGQRSWNAEIMSEWTLLQSSEDPTGEIAGGAVDGRLTIPGALMAGLPTTGLFDEWRDAGLTDRQAKVLFAHQLGCTDAQIANMLKIARSTVANTLAAGRKKIHRAE